MEKKSEYFETVALGDGTELTVRTTSLEDLESSYAFFQSMPEEQKQFLRIDVCDKARAAKRYERIDKGKTIRLIAECEGRIIGEVSLEKMRYGWLRKSGEVRMLVLPQYADKIVSEILAREVFLLAARLGLNTLLARVMEGQDELFRIFEGLHFRHEATQKKHVVDLEGNLRDLYHLTFDLRKMWSDMEHAISETTFSPMEF